MTAPLSNETEDLEALFDRIAAERANDSPTTAPVSPAPVEKVEAVALGSNDTDDLEALFDSVAAQRKESEVTSDVSSAPASGATSEAIPHDSNADVFDRVGKLTRNLHDALIQLGYDKTMHNAVNSLPDTRDRLAYIATLTGKAADRTLSAIDKAKPVQEEMEAEATGLSSKWDMLLAGNLSVDEFKALVGNTNSFLKKVPQNTKITNGELLEIMMAQDFHDLTGQVIKKIVDLAKSLETELVRLLVEISPQGSSTAQPQFEGDLNGPVINAENRTDVVTNQQQVDDLLESLGF